MKKFLLFIILFLTANASFGQAWVNDAKSLFASNNAIILTINIRNFNAVDINQNGIIETNLGETKGTFTNAIERLDEIEKLGINTIHLLPITQIGFRKALGTAGSLYAVSDFSALNPQLRSSTNSLSLKLQAKEFVSECHKRNIRVIVELPACASYDMYMKKGKWFLKDKKRNSIIPSDWSDVRILDGSNADVYNQYKAFITMMLGLNVDGIVVAEPSLKRADFWSKLITYARGQNPQFLVLAEMKPSQKKSINKNVSFVSLEKLLNVGFDGFYGDYNNVSKWRMATDLYSKVEKNKKIAKKYKTSKVIIGDFATHNDVSPVLAGGAYLSKMIIWLNSTLPVNAIYVDGFQTGDDYTFEWANLRANSSETDADIYFTHRGKLDLFNFSRKPEGSYKDIKEDFFLGNKFKNYMKDYLPKAEFVPLKTGVESVFAYAMTDRINKNTAIVIGNLDLENIKELTVKVPRLNKKVQSVLVKNVAEPQIKRGGIKTMIAPGDIQVILLKDFAIK